MTDLRSSAALEMLLQKLESRPALQPTWSSTATDNHKHEHRRRSLALCALAQAQLVLVPHGKVDARQAT